MSIFIRVSAGARAILRDCWLLLSLSSGPVSMPLSSVDVLSALEVGISASFCRLVFALSVAKSLSFDEVTDTSSFGRTLFIDKRLGGFRRKVKFGTLGLNFIGFTAISALCNRCRTQSLVRVPGHMWLAASVSTASSCMSLRYPIPGVTLGVGVTFLVYDGMWLPGLVIPVTASCPSLSCAIGCLVAM